MIKKYMIIFVLINPIRVFCSYPTVQETEALFSSNVVNFSNHIENSRYEDFFLRMKQETVMRDRNLVEAKVLNGIMSIDIFVSTNKIDDSRGISMISNGWMRKLSEYFQPVDFLTNHVMCLSMAKYMGKLKCVDYSENLLREAGPLVIMRSLNRYRRSDEEIERIKKERNEAHRMALYEANKEAYLLQSRVHSANYYVKQYRRELFSLCGRCVEGCRKTMSEDEFSYFTNQIVKVSRASQDEQRVLFRRLKKE